MKIIERFPRLVAWSAFFGGLSILLWIDLSSRQENGNIHNGGLSEFIYYGVPLGLAAFSTFCLWQAAKIHTKRILGLFELSLHLVAGFVVYALALLNYVIGSGIDTL